MMSTALPYLAHLLLLLLCGASAVAAQQPPRGSELLVRATRIVVAPDVVLENDALLIRDGKVAAVGPEIPEASKRGVRGVELDGTVVPGFVNPHSHLSLGEDLAERTDAATPDLRAADAFDPFDQLLAVHARHGVTAVGLAPLSANTLAGIAAAVRAGTTGEVLSDAAYLKIALVSESLDQRRFPTSRMGAAELLRRSFERARSHTGDDPRSTALRDALAGTTRLAVHARAHADIVAALDLCEELGLEPLLIGADEAARSLPRLAALGASIILGPLEADSAPQLLALPAQLEGAGIPFSFMADRDPSVREGSAPPRAPGARDRERFTASSPTPLPAPVPGNPENLRLSAALAVRHGLSRRAALAALTRVPAEQCGVADRCGSLRQGCFADFVVFSGDPVDLTSRCLSVFVGGVRFDPETEAR
jgi:imidazolonepropionase-like amidohydrolase